MPAFVAQEPEHCHDCWRIIWAGKAYFLTTEQAVVCPDCVWEADAIRLAGGLTVRVGEHRLLVRLRGVAVAALPREVGDLSCLRSRPSSACEAGTEWPRPGAPSRSRRCPPSRPFDALPSERLGTARTGDGAGQLQDAMVGAGTPRPVGLDRPLEYSGQASGAGASPPAGANGLRCKCRCVGVGHQPRAVKAPRRDQRESSLLGRSRAASTRDWTSADGSPRRSSVSFSSGFRAGLDTGHLNALRVSMRSSRGPEIRFW